LPAAICPAPVTGATLAILACLALLSGCTPKQDRARSGPRPSLAVAVTVAEAVQKNVPIQLNAIGAVRAYASVSIKARVDGQLARAGFKQGEEVKKGDLVFLIDPRPFDAALSQAEANLARDRASLENAEIDMRRTDELAGTKAVPATVVDANRAKVASLRATVAADQAVIESAKLQVSYCYITAPVSGRVGLLLVDEGNMVKNNETVLAVINQIRPTYIDFAVPEQSLPDVRRAAASGRLRVEATVPQHPETRVSGELEVINNQVDTTTGTILLRAVLPNQDELLWPGQFVSVCLTLGDLTNAVVVPSAAVQSSQSGEFVFAVKPDASVEKRLVTLGPERDGQMVIRNGVRSGETVVTDGQMRLAPGARVSIKTNVPPAARPLAEERGS
jgi:multidrug efflux system membrane fusion protein